MKVLIVCSYKESLPHNMAPFIWEQAEALSKLGVEIKYYLVKGRGAKGYLKEVSGLKKAIKDYQPNIVHAHFGLCGLLANLQRRVPVVTTYHGSDINNPRVRKLSRIAIRLSAFNIFVSKRQLELVNPRKHYDVIPCGINLKDYPEIEKSEAREQMGLDQSKKYVLFAGAFDNPVKNPQLAKDAVRLLPDVELLELKGYSRHQVALLMNAVDCFLMTSHTEGSPQVIKEAMACGCPIVSVDVGDINILVNGIDGCFICPANAYYISVKIKLAFTFKRINGKSNITSLELDNTNIGRKINNIYKDLSHK